LTGVTINARTPEISGINQTSEFEWKPS